MRVDVRPAPSPPQPAPPAASPPAEPSIDGETVQVEVTRLAPTSPPPASPDHCSVQDCERDVAEAQAEYQQAVAEGRKEEQDGLCMFAGLLFAATASDSECDETDGCMTHPFMDCSCELQLPKQFAGVSDCPDLLARMERVCEKLRACADPDSGDPDSGPGLAIGLAVGSCLLVAMLAAAVFVWHRKRRMQTPTGSSTRAPQQVEVTVAQPDSQKV